MNMTENEKKKETLLSREINKIQKTEDNDSYLLRLFQDGENRGKWIHAFHYYSKVSINNVNNI